MNKESTRMRLKRIARPIIEEEFRITDAWDIVGDQRNTEWQVKIWGEPMVQFLADDDSSDSAITDTIRSQLGKLLR